MFRDGPFVILRRRRQIGTLTVQIPALGLAAFVLASCGVQAPAPAPARIAAPISSDATLLASKVGGDPIDTELDRTHYRYEAISEKTLNQTELMLAELRTLTHAGWRDIVTFRINPCNGATVVQGVPPTAPGANVLINSPNRKIYAALSNDTGQTGPDDPTNGTPLLGNRTIRNAIKHRESVLLISLGHGTHGRMRGSKPGYHSTSRSCASANG